MGAALDVVQPSPGPLAALSPSVPVAPRAAGDDGWRAAPDEADPVVLLLGGFLTSAPLYRLMARRLRQRGAAEVVIASIWTPDWLLVPWHGLGPLATRAGRALLRAGRVSAASPRSRGAPVLVVGHSAGGALARLLTSPVPFDGRRLAAADRMGAIVTLGTPHHVAADAQLGRWLSAIAARFADEHIPGAMFVPRVGYVTVASRAVQGRADGDGRARAALRLYQGLLATSGEEIDGDGLVPVTSALLDGSESIVLDDVVHGPLGGGEWYGSGPVIDRWWPAAIDAWHRALRARTDDSGPSSRGATR